MQSGFISATCHQHANKLKVTGEEKGQPIMTGYQQNSGVHSIHTLHRPSLISHQLFAELPYIIKKIKMTYCEYICTLYLKLLTNNISCLFSTSYSCADENIILKASKTFIKYTFYYFMTTKVRKYKIRNIFQ